MRPLGVFLGLDLGFRLVRRAGKRQWSLGRKSNKEFYQGTAMRGADNTEWWAMWKARYVMLNCSVQVSLFAASIFSRWERSSAQEKCCHQRGASFSTFPPRIKSAHPALAFRGVHNPASADWLLPLATAVSDSEVLAATYNPEASRYRAAEHRQAVLLFIVPIHLFARMMHQPKGRTNIVYTSC